MIFVKLEIIPFEANIPHKINKDKIAKPRILVTTQFSLGLSRSAFRVAQPEALVRCSCKVPSVKATRAAKIASCSSYTDCICHCTMRRMYLENWNTIDIAMLRPDATLRTPRCDERDKRS